MKISPELIPHTQFHTGAWLLSVERPDWYYFRKKSKPSKITNKRFLKTIDRPLRSLVSFLHSKGIKTTPSCSGHHFSERNLEKMYDNLEADRDAIQTRGLQLKDVETGKTYFFRDKNYSLPWSREEFISQVTTYQKKGVLGLRLGKHKNIMQHLLKLNVNGASIKKDKGIILFFTDNETGDNTKAWKKITKEVKRVFNF